MSEIPAGARTSQYYRTNNIPERFDNPEEKNKQICYMPGNIIFTCVRSPPSVSNNANIVESQEIFRGYPDKKINPLFRTSNSDYGAKRPNVHTMPTNYFPNTSGFTEHLGKCGMYRDNGLNCNSDKSKV